MTIPMAKRIGNAVSAALLLSFTALAFAPVHLYSSNILEFNFSFANVIKVCLLASMSLALLIFLLTVGLPRPLHEKGVAMTTILALLVWIQENFLLWPYGIFDGRDIEWHKFLGRGIIDVIVWIVLLLVAWFASAFIYKQVKRIAFLLLLIQVLSISIDIVRMPPLHGRHYYEFDRSSEFSFSATSNILLLLPDAFQGDIFQELLVSEPGWAQSFPGFTYYPNSVGGYSSTLFAVPYILTGQMYDKTPTFAFIRRAFNRSLPGLLLQNGFRSEIYPLMFDLIDYNPSLASNLLPKKEINPAEIAFLFDVALFRSLPQPGKKLIFNNQLWFLKRLFPDSQPALNHSQRSLIRAKNKEARLDVYSNYDKSLASAMEEQADAAAARPTFKYFHLRGLHLPILSDRECRYQPMPISRENLLAQAYCCLNSISRILNALKKIGVYEHTMIFIIGDHGLGARGLRLRSDLYVPAPAPGPGDPRLARVKAEAMSLFLVKPFGASDPFRQSLAPVTLGDIPKTVLAALHIEANIPGTSIFSLNENSRRRRPFVSGTVAIDTWKKHAVSYEYLVDGLSWLDSSWRLMATNLLGKSVQGAPAKETAPDKDTAEESE